MTRRVICIILALIMILAAFAGCGKKENKPAETPQQSEGQSASAEPSGQSSASEAGEKTDAGEARQSGALEQFLADPVSTARSFNDEPHKIAGFIRELLADASEDDVEAVGRILFERFGEMYGASYQFTQQLNSEYLKLFSDVPHLEIYRHDYVTQFALPLDEKTAEGIKEALSDVSRRLPQAGIRPSPEEYPDFSDIGIAIMLPGGARTRIRMDESGRVLLWVLNILSAAGLNSPGSSYVDCPELCSAVIEQVEAYTGWKYTPLSQISGFESVLLYEGESPVASAEPEPMEELLRRIKPLGFAPNWHGVDARISISCKNGSGCELEIASGGEETFIFWLFPCFFYRFENAEDNAAFWELFGLEELPGVHIELSLELPYEPGTPYDAKTMFIPGHSLPETPVGAAYDAEDGERLRDAISALYSRYIEKISTAAEAKDLRCIDILGDGEDTVFPEKEWLAAIKPEYAESLLQVYGARVSIRIIGGGDDFTVFCLPEYIMKNGNSYELITEDLLPYKEIHSIQEYEELYAKAPVYEGEGDICDIVMQLCEEILLPLTEAAPDRAFVLSSFKTEKPEILGLGEYMPENEEWQRYILEICDENTWYVEPRFSGEWYGVYSPIGPSWTAPESVKSTFEGGMSARILVRDGDKYTLYLASDYLEE